MILAGTIDDGRDERLLEFVKTYNDETAYKRLVVLINIIKANPTNIKLQVDAICDKHYIKNIPLMCYTLKYFFRTESRLIRLMGAIYDEKDEMDDGSYLIGCDMLKSVYKFKDMIFSDKIVVTQMTA